jgi:transposase
MAIVSVGIDLAKNVFAVHGVDESGKPALVRPSVPRTKLLELIASLPPCLIGMEACSGAHHWAREFVKFGHTVRLMAPKFVIPSRLSGKRGKNDAADAAATGGCRVTAARGDRCPAARAAQAAKCSAASRALPLGGACISNPR